MITRFFETITYYTSYHINLKYILTPISIIKYDFSDKRVKMIYIFGIRVFRQTIA